MFGKYKTWVGVCWLFMGIALWGIVPGQGWGAKLRVEGRRLLWEDQSIRLVGFSYYGLVGDRQFDGEAFLETLAAHNINFTRFFLILPWPVDQGPNLLAFRKIGKKYDLRQFDDDFFARLRAIVKRAEELGIVCQVCLFDRCGLSVADRRAWENNPYNADRNVNGFFKDSGNGYPRFCRVEGAPAEINAAYIAKVVDTLGDCSNVIYEIINEPYHQLGDLPLWHEWVARLLRQRLQDRPGSRVISAGQSQSYDNREIDLFAMHSASDDRRVAAAVRQSKTLNKPVILSDDGDSRCMFIPEVTRDAAARALGLGQHFEHLAYTLTLQREVQGRPAARLYEMPGLCRLNLRNLAELAKPLGLRPYLRNGRIITRENGAVFTACLERGQRGWEVEAEISADGGRTWRELPVTVNQSVITSEPLPAGKDGCFLVRAVCVDRQFRRWPGPAIPFYPGPRRSVLLGEEVVEKGLLRVRPHRPDGVVRPARRGGKACYEIDLNRRSKYAYFRLEDPFPRETTPALVTIVIEYFDHPAGGRLVLEYDGANGPYTPAAPLLMNGSGQWRTARFRLQDALFRHRQNDGADFRFSLQDSQASLAIRSLRIEYPAGMVASQRAMILSIRPARSVR